MVSRRDLHKKKLTEAAEIQFSPFRFNSDLIPFQFRSNRRVQSSLNYSNPLYFIYSNTAI